MNEYKKLYRSRDNRIVSGLCAGIGKYMGIDPTVVRVAVTIASVVLAGVPVVIYLIMVLIVPEEPIGGIG